MSTVSQSNNSIQINGAPLTAKVSAENSTLLTNDIDRRIAKIRPMSTPVDQLSRCGDIRRVGSMKVNYYTSDVKDVSTEISRALTGADLKSMDEDGIAGTLTVTVKNAAIFSVTETALIPDILDDDGKPLYMYITEVGPQSVSGLLINNIGNFLDTVNKVSTLGMKVVRMGRAAGELDVQSPQYETLPRRNENFCQIFKMQVEESTLHRLSNKEAQWGFSDQEEAAIIDMRQGMEKNFIFGVKTKFSHPETGDDVYLTGGIWNQITSETIEMAESDLKEHTLIEICRKSFTGGKGSHRKILMGGSGFIEALSKIKCSRLVINDKTLVRWGIEFREIRSNFGTLYVLLNEIFDQCGHENDAMIIDPNMITKYVHIPMTTEKLDLRSAGTRNTDAVVITEASCLVLRNPACHSRITIKKEKN